MTAMFLKRSRIFAATLAGLFVLSAGPVGAEISEAEIKQLIDSAHITSDDIATERNLSALLARTDFSVEQRITLLFQRAGSRANVSFNVPGALADWREVLTLAPAGHWSVQPAHDRIAENESKLASRLQGASSPDPKTRINALLELGRHDEAAQAFRAEMERDPTGGDNWNVLVSGGYRGTIHVLSMMGYLCEGPGYSGPVLQWALNDVTHSVQWCDTKAK